MTKAEPTAYSILFVCTGNTCRSPLAEVLARVSLERRGWSHVKVDSAGEAAAWDAPASEGSLQAAADVGLDLSGHRSQPLTRELVANADIILAMTPSLLLEVETSGGEGKASLLTELINGEGAGEPIPDPIGSTPDVYAEVRDQISSAIEGLLDRLSAILAP